MVFSTTSERPLTTSLGGNSADTNRLATSPLTDSRANPLQSETGLLSSSADPLAVSPGVRVTLTDFVGNTAQTAHRLGDLNNATYRYTESVSSTDINDFYGFRLNQDATVTLSLTGMSADADLYLLDGAGNTTAVSDQFGSTNESISRFLRAGVYYAQVSAFAGSSTSYDIGVSVGGTDLDPGGSLNNARDLGNLSRSAWNVNNTVGTGDLNDYYRFDLSENGNFRLNLSGLSSDVDVALYNRTGSFITASSNAGTSTEAINRFLDAGTYYIRVYPWSGSSDYTLGVSTDTPSYYGTRTLTGTLGADTFDVTGNYTRTVISGSGNVDFGTGRRDVLDLSGLLSNSVSINYSNTTGGGVFYDPGNGTRVFDSILFNDGRQVLFEGIDQIRFRDRTINLSITPNDPLFSQQWNLGMMGVQNAWRFTTGSDQVMIGVQDTGLALTAQGRAPDDLQRRYWFWTANDYDDDFFRAIPGPFYGPQSTSHGTSVQSIIAADSNNGRGMSGINWTSEVYVTDVLDGNPGDLSLAQATRSMAGWAASQGQRLVINMSLGSSGFNQTGIEPEFEATVAANPNVLFVIAAGNDGNEGRVGLSYPATLANIYSNVMAVGASWGRTDYYGNPQTPGTRIEYSNWGSQYGKGLTLMGPSEVTALSATRFAGPVSFDYTSRFNGTSAAAPNVTGVASLVWSANANLSATQVREILSQTATDLGSAGYDQYYGNGFVNADAAVRRAIAIGAGYA